MGLPGTIAGGGGVALPSSSSPGAAPLGGMNNIVPFRPPTPVSGTPAVPAPVTPPPTAPSRPTAVTPGTAIGSAGTVGAIAAGVATGIAVGATGGTLAESIAAGAGATVGGLVGQGLGAAVGTLAGNPLAGAIAGGTIGSTLGAIAGQYVGQLISDAITPTTITPDIVKTPGSTPGVQYTVRVIGDSGTFTDGWAGFFTGPVNFAWQFAYRLGIYDYVVPSVNGIEINQTGPNPFKYRRDTYQIGLSAFLAQVSASYPATITRTDGQPEGTTPGTFTPNPARNPSGEPYNPANRPYLPALSPSPAGFVPPPLPQITPPQPQTEPETEPQPQRDPRRAPPLPLAPPNPNPAPGVVPNPEIDPGRVPAPVPSPGRQPAPATPRQPRTIPGVPGTVPDIDAPPGIPPVAPPLAPPGVPTRPPLPPAPPIIPESPPGTPTIRPPADTPNRLINPPGTNTGPQLQPITRPQPQPNETPQNPRCCQPDLSELIERLEQIKLRIGFARFPVSVPDQIAAPNTGQRSVEDLAALQVWHLEQLDGVLGRWPAGLSIPGADGKPISMNMANVSEAMKEQIGMLTSMSVTLAQTFNAATRAVIQAGSATQQAHLAHLIGKANAEFLGYDQQTTATSIPLTYSPGLNPLEGLFNESNATIKGFQNTDRTDLKHILAELLQAAAIIRAVFWRKLDPKEDFEKQVRDIVKSKSEFLNSEEHRERPTESDWEEYLRQVEQGFLDYRNIKSRDGKPESGEDSPYNRGPESFPKIKDISDGDTDRRKEIEKKRRDRNRE